MKTKKEREFVDSTIKLIEEGKIYKKMWEEFDELYGHFDIIPLGTSYHIYELMERLKQKYFPKEIKSEAKIKAGDQDIRS